MLLRFSTNESFSDDAEGAARLAEEFTQLNLEKTHSLVVPERLSPPATNWLARLRQRKGAGASRALRCTALRLAGYDIVQVVDEFGYDAIVARRT